MTSKRRSPWLKAGIAVGTAILAVGAYGYLWLRKLDRDDDATPPGLKSIQDARRAIDDLRHWGD